MFSLCLLEGEVVSFLSRPLKLLQGVLKYPDLFSILYSCKRGANTLAAVLRSFFGGSFLYYIQLTQRTIVFILSYSKLNNDSCLCIQIFTPLWAIFSTLSRVEKTHFTYLVELRALKESLLKLKYCLLCIHCDGTLLFRPSSLQ